MEEKIMYYKDNKFETIECSESVCYICQNGFMLTFVTEGISGQQIAEIKDSSLLLYVKNEYTSVALSVPQNLEIEDCLKEGKVLYRISHKIS